MIRTVRFTGGILDGQTRECDGACGCVIPTIRVGPGATAAAASLIPSLEEFRSATEWEEHRYEFRRCPDGSWAGVLVEVRDITEAMWLSQMEHLRWILNH